MKPFFLFSFLLLMHCAWAQPLSPRSVQNMNEAWLFRKADSAVNDTGWQAVRLPHTWNAADVMDDEPGYYRGEGWYRKMFRLPAAWRDKNVSLYFEGANQEADVFVNGKKAGTHVGGYTAFSVPITPYLNVDSANEIFVKLTNRFNENIAPLSADFTFYGGVYRDVYLVATNKVHFSTDDYGSSGVYITTPSVSRQAGRVLIKSRIAVNGHVAGLSVTTTIRNSAGRKVAEVSSPVNASLQDGGTVLQQTATVKDPELWSPEHPYRYTVETRIVDARGKVVDAVQNPLGFRWFRFDAAGGFFLNGTSYKLLGASRHQDYKGLGNAVPDSLAVRDVVLLKAMGANFLRVAHYPQDPCVLRACDSLGLLTSVEIPVVNEISETDSFARNCEQMLTEMIRQNFNHPSVVLWCYMNEVLLRPHFNEDKPQQERYYASVAKLAQRLEALARREDSSRYTIMANHGNLPQYKTAGLLEIPMVVGWNLYSGWYGGKLEEFPKFLDEFHAAYPDKPFLVTEYGADADPRIRSLQPVRFDKSIEYTTRFHQFYLAEMQKRPFVAGAVVWNLADFNSETRAETMPHMNNKGLLQWDRTPKDPYYFYQAVLSKKPVIHILGSCRGGLSVADSSLPVCHRLVQVASNLDSVRLVLNGHRQAAQKVVDGLCEWTLPFREGRNTLVAEGEKNGNWYRDSATVPVQLQPFCLSDTRYAFQQLNVLLGTSRFFMDETGSWWQPDQAYWKGGWGSVGGEKFRLSGNTTLPSGTDKNIRGTDDDPVYQTQQAGIRQYRLDVPPGRYQVTLHFAELATTVGPRPAGHLLPEGKKDTLQRRVFTVKLNGRCWLDRLNLARDYGVEKAVRKSIVVIVEKEEGIKIDFDAVEGEPVLNALQLTRLPDDTNAVKNETPF